MLKKFISLILVFLLAVSLGACSSSEPKSDSPVADKPATEEPVADKPAIEEPAIENTEDSGGAELSLEYIFENSDSELLDQDSIKGYDSVLLQIGINEIYAKHGYSFQGKHWKKYFENKSWYKADKNFSESSFNDIEKKNIEFLKSVETPIKLEDRSIPEDLLSGKFGPVFSAVLNEIGGENPEFEDYDTYLGTLITDIDINDGKINALVFDAGPSADPNVSIYSYNEETGKADFIINNFTYYYDYEIKGAGNIELEAVIHGIYGSATYSLKSDTLELESENLARHSYTLSKDVGQIKKGTKVHFVGFEYVDNSDLVNGIKISPDNNNKIVESITYTEDDYPGTYTDTVSLYLITEMFEEITMMYYGD